MGMAASQARFLGLTARKTNTEFEGQQINQQRTSLSNQSANYYNQLLGMSVPVPPSVSDYTKTTYIFTDGSLTNTISSIYAQNNGEYIISYTSSYVDDFSIVSSKRNSLINKVENIEGIDNSLYEEFTKGTAGGCYTYAMEHDGNQISHIKHVLAHLINVGTHTTSDGNLVTIKSSDQYWGEQPDPPYGGVKSVMASIREKIENKPVYQEFIDLMYKCNTSPSTAEASDILKARLKELVENNLKMSLSDGYKIGNDNLRILGSGYENKENYEYLKSLSDDQLKKLEEEEIMYLKMLNNKFGYDENITWYVRYIKNTTTNEWEPYFYSSKDLGNAVYDKNTLEHSYIPSYTISATQKTEEIKGVNARMEQDACGRIISITLNPDQPDQVTYSVTTNTVTDQDAYNDAMNQYEYNKYKYDQSIKEINAKIEIVQAQDKNLELRLKQLDTEQDAISTEMDAVQKVIEKNTESTFKTFG